jgi:hypothetical protein
MVTVYLGDRIGRTCDVHGLLRECDALMASSSWLALHKRMLAAIC